MSLGINVARRFGASAALNRTIHESAKVVVTGGFSGRLGQKIVKEFSPVTPVIPTSSKHKMNALHLPLTVSVEEMKQKFKDSKMVVHSASISEGSYEEIRKVNVEGTEKLFRACKELSIPVLFLSTSASKIDGLSPDKTPYAYSKRQAEKLAIEQGIPVARLGVLVGDEHGAVTSLCHMAGTIGSFPSVSVRTPDCTIQPIDYESAAQSVVAMVKEILDKENYKEVIDVVGDPVSLHEFLDMINSSAIRIHVKPKDLEKMASLVNNGAFSPEFIELSKLGCKQLNNDRVKNILGPNFKTVVDVADEAKKEINFTKLLSIAKKVLTGKDNKFVNALLLEFIKVVRCSRSDETYKNAQ